MNTALRWTIAIVGWLVLLIIYSVWKDVERHTGGGLITGFLRGLIVFGGAYYIYKWAKSKNYANNSLPEYINTVGLTQNPKIFRIIKIYLFTQPSEPMGCAALAACNETTCLS